MSWFDASSFATIAKTALKEAQKTIDKALDIRDDGGNFVPTNTPVDTNSDDFFGSWGITSNSITSKKGTPEAITKSPVKSNKQVTSIWGSFTGSFFDAPIENDTSKELLDSLDDSIDINNDFKESKLVVQDSEYNEIPQKLPDVDDVTVELDVSPKVTQSLGVSFDENALQQSSENVIVRKRDKNIVNSNRLSIISCESDKKSSESVEVLSNTECTTSPDSDALSFGQSISTASSGMKPASDSVEILIGSITSPSSVEILESESLNSRRESQHTDEFISPLASPEEISGLVQKC